MSTYQINIRCSTCDVFMNRGGAYKSKTVWRCKCCNMPVRHTSYAGRKDLIRRELITRQEIGPLTT